MLFIFPFLLLFPQFSYSIVFSLVTNIFHRCFNKNGIFFIFQVYVASFLFFMFFVWLALF